jgi:hypothetical protein
MKVSNMEVHMKLNHKKRKSIKPEGFRFTGFSTLTSVPAPMPNITKYQKTQAAQKVEPNESDYNDTGHKPHFLKPAIKLYRLDDVTDSDMRIKTNYSNRTAIMDTQIDKMRNFKQLEPELKMEDYNDMQDPNILSDTEPKHTELETEEDSLEFETITLELTLVNTQESFGDPLGQDMLDTGNRNVLNEIVNCCSKLNAREDYDQHLDGRDILCKTNRKNALKWE